jgi:photosystem II stability/assembly factor-like uncharacterized protein
LEWLIRQDGGMVSGNDGDSESGRARAGMSAEHYRSLPRRESGLAVAAAAAVLAAAAAGLVGCGATGYRPPASAAGRAAVSASPLGKIHPSLPAATGVTPPPGMTPPAGLAPDVTLAYFQHGVGLVGVAPLGGGWQDYEPSTLWLTTDSGPWRDVTPPGARRGAVAGDYPLFEAASFLDPATGWVTTWDAANDDVTMYSTRDGGASWTAVRHSGHTANAGATDLIQLVTPQLVFSETLEPTAPGMDLQATTDGGRSWHSVYTGPPSRRPGSPLAGPFEMPMVFVSASRGFSADGIPPADPIVGAGQGGFFASSDGGRNWVRESPPLASPPPACAASPGNATSCVFALPVFTGATRGVLPSEVLTGTSATVGFATTSDSGYAWTLASTLHVPLPKRSVTAVPAAGYALIALPSASTWWVLAAAQRGVTSWVSTDSGRSWSATDGAVPGTPLALQAINASRAWLTALVNKPAGSSRVLYATSDGGRSWQQVLPG